MKEIPLTKGQVALVDDNDYDYLSQWKWYANKSWKTFYAVRGVWNGRNTDKILMHRLILGIKDKKIEVDHRDRNGLNNQRSNLRAATHSQNIINSRKKVNASSKYFGVCWRKKNNKWVSQIHVGKKAIHLGYFDHEVEAAKAYNESVKKYHGEFANLNTI